MGKFDNTPTVADFKRSLTSNPRCVDGTCPNGKSHIFRYADEMDFKVFKGTRFAMVTDEDIKKFRDQLCDCAIYANSKGMDEDLGEIHTEGRVYKTCPFFRGDDDVPREVKDDMMTMALASLKPGEREKFLKRHELKPKFELEELEG